MGFWKNVFTLGGAYFLDKARERYVVGSAEYRRITDRLASVNAEIDRTVARLRVEFGRTKRTLKIADQMLNPPCLKESPHQRIFPLETPLVQGTKLSVRSNLGQLGAGSTQLAMIGASAGTTAAIAAWQGVQVIGIASTGTAIGGIYGAAASNAGWASFGGGSLATGGGGMALGHIVLPGVGLLIGVGVGAYSTYSKAIEIEKLCDELETANDQNEAALAKTDQAAQRLRQAVGRYKSADESLHHAIRTASRKLRRFGWFSIFYRWIRFKLNGVYYTSEEQGHVANLERSVQDFMNMFGVTP